MTAQTKTDSLHVGELPKSGNTLEWIATTLSFIGAFLNSTGNHFVSAMVVWIIANCFWIAYAIPRKQWGLFTTQLGFCLIQIYGISHFIK
ncbi:MAG TPA: hypothetical protein HPP97_06975 [Desulfuromonadales bacterium]|nr:hypothetical protein [Desulfuromonadales bacterium]